MEGKVVLVTGGARRVGAAICRLLHGAGANLVVHYRSAAAEAQALKAELDARRGGSVSLARADLLSAPAAAGLVATAVREFGRLDALVNNASSFFATRIGGITEAQWEDLVGTNLKAPLFLSQAAAPELRQRRGCIVNIIDIHAERPLKDHAVYTAAKGGLAALTRALARDLGPEVRVNGVAPGTILWPETAAWGDPDSRRAIVEQTLLKRVGDPEELAVTVRFLIAEATYMTGQIVAVDGGRGIAL